MLVNVSEGDKVDSLLTLKRKTDVNGRPCMNKWCPDSESNQGHGDFQSPALPTELSGQRGALNLIRLVSSIKFLQFTADCTIYHHFAANARIVRQTRRSRRRKGALPEGVLEAC